MTSTPFPLSRRDFLGGALASAPVLVLGQAARQKPVAAFFREVSKRNAMPPQDPAFWRRYGMEVLGPPLQV